MVPHLERYSSYEQARDEFRLEIPGRFNIAEAACGRHEDAATRVALIECQLAGINTYTFGAISLFSDKFANVLRGRGVGVGDRVAVSLRQSAALPVAHLGALKLGATVVPLPAFLRQSELEFTLRDSSAKTLVIDSLALKQLRAFTGETPSVESVFVTSDEMESPEADVGTLNFWREVYDAASDIETADTQSSAPAYVFYPTGREEPGRGVIHGHGLLAASLPAFEMHNNFDLGPDTVFYSLGNWADVRILFGMLYPAWVYGRPVVAGAAWIFVHPDMFELFERCEVTNLFIEPDEIDTLMREVSDPWSEYDLKIRNLCAFDSPHLPWIRGSFSASANLAFGPAEAPMVVASCERWYAHRSRSWGRPVPGHQVEIIDESGRPLPRGEMGLIAVGRSDPALFLGYLNDSDATESIFTGDWLPTGETGVIDDEGYVRPSLESSGSVKIT
ncbi:MAG TPA: AMP-binding protein [Blastocatellia bacterium]|nr:AMP-binding protein [Blastocatellia bacterium]